MNNYLSRRLSYPDESGKQVPVLDLDIDEMSMPLIILGEPGMGKSSILEWLSKRHGWKVCHARSFVEHPYPSRLVPPGGRLIIDGLDELSAAREFDPVNRVLGKLLQAERPNFILSCRSADWRGASASQEISNAYDEQPRLLSLLPFDRADAVAFLGATLGDSRAEEVVAYLEARGVKDLYGNPMTLSLFAKVAASGNALPETKGDLMLQAVKVLWSEHSESHGNLPLAALDEATALDAAGAICAALILGGCEAASTLPPHSSPEFTIPLAELQSLPGSSAARTIIGSRLFVAALGNAGSYKPLHRTIAEFLGARWIARQADNERDRSRISAMLTVDGGVPASLRGLHAWLVQDPAFAPRVIETDPYGVLRYGDADGLSPAQGRLLLRSLRALQREDPYFRAGDWDRHPARGLVHPVLRDEVREALLTKETGFHFRTLLLEVLRGSPLGVALQGELWRMVNQQLAFELSYSEREDALLALLAARTPETDWNNVVLDLVNSPGEDGLRLAMVCVKKVGFDAFTPERVAWLIEEIVRKQNQGERTGGNAMLLYGLAGEMPLSLIEPLLDLLATSLPTIRRTEDSYYPQEIDGLIEQLVARVFETRSPNAEQLLAWLKIARNRSNAYRASKTHVAEMLCDSPELKRSMQELVINGWVEQEFCWNVVSYLSELSPGLALDVADIIDFLERSVQGTNCLVTNEASWRDLVVAGLQPGPRRDDVIGVARRTASDNPERSNFLDRLLSPRPMSDWEIRSKERQAIESRHQRHVRDSLRAELLANENSLRNGKFPWIYQVAQLYFGEFEIEGLDTASPSERMESYLGADLFSAAQAGLEAVLHRSDLPPPATIAESFANGKRYSILSAVLAGVDQRLSNCIGLNDIDPDVILSARLSVDQIYMKVNVLERFKEALNARLQTDEGLISRFIELTVEPSLVKGSSHISGLYDLMQDEAARPILIERIETWLQRIEDMSGQTERDFVDFLINQGRVETVLEISKLRLQRKSKTLDEAHYWIAARTWAEPGFVTSALMRPVHPAMLWSLRRVFGGESRNASLDWIPTRTAALIISTFRDEWPLTPSPEGGWSGDTNPWDASDFLRQLTNRLAGDKSGDAADALHTLVAMPSDGYTPGLQHALASQRQLLRELRFAAVSVARLKNVLLAGPPATIDELLEEVQWSLGTLQAELLGNDTDSYRKYWNDKGEPRDEGTCTQRLVEDFIRHFRLAGVGRTIEAHMPRGKRADILLTFDHMSLPVECKGQWNPDLWSAPTEQLDALYLLDDRTSDRGIYLVYWFGSEVGNARRPKKRPGDIARPASAEELKRLLSAVIPPERRNSLIVEVLDLTPKPNDNGLRGG